MKTFLLVSTCMFFVMNLSAQKLAKRNQYKKLEDNSLVSFNKDFKSYASTATNQLNEVNSNLKQLEFLSKYQLQSTKKLGVKLKSLEIESAELNEELSQYQQNGIGDWKVFQREFNGDLALVLNDIQVLQDKYEPKDLIVSK